MAMRLPDETRASNAADNMSVFAPHFQRVYNNHRSVDFEYAAHIPQQRILWELNDPITWDEFMRAVKKLKNTKAKNTKAPGLAGVPPDHTHSPLILNNLPK